MTTLVLGEPSPQPTIGFWLEEQDGELWLRAKHSEDSAYQNIARIGGEAGQCMVEFRCLFAGKLCEHLGIGTGETIRWTVEERDPLGARGTVRQKA